MSDNNKTMPQGAAYDAVTLTDLVTRFAAYLEIYNEETLTLAANWLQGALRESEGNADAVRDRYILTTAIDALRNAASQDLNGNPKMERTPQAELATLRVSVARLAQRLGVETKSLPVIGADFGELSKLAKEKQRGWNALIAKIEAEIMREVE